MKKRILSLLLALTMVLGMLPASALAAGTVTEISTADELIALGGKKLTGSYELGGDIDMSGKTMSLISSLSGSFDGKGHTIKNLTLTGTSNVGLFAEAKNGAVIQGILLENCSVQSTSGSYTGVGALVGKVSGSTTIAECGVLGGSVESSSSSAYVGGLVGYGSAAVTIKDCFSIAEVTGKSRTGGIIGSATSGSTLENCYARGTVTVNSGNGGGLAGYTYGSSSNKIVVNNCYSAVSVTGSSAKKYAVAYNYNYTDFTNCYYDSSINTGVNACYVSNTNVVGKTTDELKALADTLGDAFRNDVTPNLNGGYPILGWQYFDPDAKYTVSFTVEPKEAVLTWSGTAQDVNANGQYTFTDVAVGSYDYSVAYEAGDYGTKSGTVQVKNKDVSTTVTLELNKHDLTFTLSPADAELTVKSGETTLEPRSVGGLTYSVTRGDYTYTASAFGYETDSGSVTVGTADETKAVTLTAQPAVTATFSYADHEGDVTGGKLVVTTDTGSDKRTMTAEAGTEGMVYDLPVGYAYDWTFTSANYARQTGAIDLTGTTEPGTRSVTILMAAKTKWEGAGDITEPAKVDGVYQINSGSELAWLAQEVNAGRGATYNAVLCRDIDLNSESWTPIGKSGSYYSYKGTFDGQGHKISNLSVTGSTSNNYGLFGYVNGGTIKNLTVAGSVTITGSGSSSYGIGAVVGQLYGTATVENCLNEATVSGNYNTGGIVGYANGSSYEKTISGCVNLGAVSGSSNVGGIVGQFCGKGSVQNCYDRGDVRGSFNSGGIVGYLYSSSSSYKNTVSNCYSTGAVTGNSDCNAVLGKIYSKTNSTVTDCYYLSTEGGKTDTNATGQSADDLKDLTKTLLGDAYLAAPAGLNDGYPILKWQVPTYTVIFTVSPANAKVTIEGQTGTRSGSTWTFKLPDGEYDYTVSAFGYTTQTGSVTVNGAAASETVTLTEAVKKAVTFAITPEAAAAKATVTVTWNDETVAPQEGGGYLLPYGTYPYTVKAKGYARATGTLRVDAESSGTVAVELTASTAWDGTVATEAPSGAGTQTSPYEIDSGEALAWLAAAVNKAASGTKFYAKLTDDINLDGIAWTPIGKDLHEFSGEFDGQGNTVSGLSVSGVEYAGLFGVAKDATIKDVVVKGTVSGTDDAGGIVGRTTGTANTITNCGSEAAVTGKYAGGILGNSNAYNCKLTLTGCYNTGDITAISGASNRAGGIVGRCNGSSSDFVLSNCYNTGSVSSEAYASGIYAGSGVNISNSYTAGTITSTDSDKIGAFTTGSYDTLTNCYYLAGSVPEGAKVGVATSFTTLTVAQLGETNWKIVRGVNNGLPVLTWQKDTAPTDTVTLADNAQFTLESVISLEGEESLLPTGSLTWAAKKGAASYTVTLWRQTQTWSPLSDEELAEYREAAAENDAQKQLRIADEAYIISKMTEEERATLALRDDALADAQNALLMLGENATVEQVVALVEAEEERDLARAQFIVSTASESDLGSYSAEYAWVRDINGVTGTSYDLTGILAALDEGVYFASAAVETAGEPAYVSQKTMEEKIVGTQYPYNRMQAVTNVRWDGTIARWGAKTGFTRSQTYQIDLYTVTDGGGSPTYTLSKSFTMPGQYTSANLANEFAAGQKYAFRVTALSDEELMGRLGLTDSRPSGFSGIYDTAAPGTDPAEKEWVEISTAEEWIALANTPDEPSAGSGSDSKQLVEWTKNYRLKNDIDFSTLSAEDQAKTKSIGTVTYPFMGEFDGNGKKITGLTLSNYDSGLFWYMGATGHIHDLTIDNANVLFSDNAAVLVHNNKGLVEKCAVVNTNITADTGAVLGGMVSRNYGIIRNSYVQGGTLTANTTTAVGHAGFAGSNEEGGLIENCWTSMDVTTQSAHAGGFVGLGYGGTIRNCFALGNVSARDYSGGFVGRSVYDGNTYENCYAAGTVTVTGVEGNGFIGGNQPWSAFQPDQSEGVTNCYYNSANTGTNTYAYGAEGKSLTEMATADFLAALSSGTVSVWEQAADKNNGLPYLVGVAVPANATTTEITVTLAIASYNKDTYAFKQMGGDITVTMDSTGNTRLVDLMDAAVAQNKLTYSYATTSAYGRFIETINGRSVNAPDGWMFTINDVLSNVSASLATVKNGDKVLWFEGTTENRFQGPTWDELKSSTLTWERISTEAQLRALAAATDAETLSKNYRLTKDLTLTGGPFPGIGTADAPFTGIFDGQNKTISGVTVSGGENAGFFGVIKGATVKNLKLAGVSVTGTTKVGGLVGWAQASLSGNAACLIGNCSVTGTVSGTESVGGLVGLNAADYNDRTGFSIASAVDKCTADVAVTGTTKVGGLVGDNGGTVTRGAAKGDVTGSGNSSKVGGLAGNSTGDLYESHAEGTVSGKSRVGGFAGYSDGVVKECYSLGAVSGAEYTGSFAGALPRADTVLGAGQVTVTGGSSVGYNGGFAGYLGGTLTGPANQITVKNVFGNCTQAVGENIKVVGNTSNFSTDSQQAALTAMKLDTWGAVGEKLYELFGVTLTLGGTDADTEAAKYADGITVPAGTAANTVLSLLKNGQTASGDVTVTYEVDETYAAYLAGGSTLTLVKANDTAATISIPVRLELSSPNGYAGREVTVILSVSNEKQDALMDTIARTYTETTDLWAALDMALYASLEGKTAKLTDEARQALVNTIIGKVSGTKTPGASDLSKYELVLRALGVDSTRLYPINSNTPVSNAALLAAAQATSGGYYAAPWVLLAGMQGNAQLPQATVDARIGQLKDNMGEDGLFGSAWGTSPDTSGATLSALARFYSSSADAKAAVDTILANLPSAMDAKGSFGSANSDAMVIIGLLAVGRDPAELKASTGASVVDGMLSYLNTATNQFRYNGKDNALATEQAFRALAALALYDGQNPCNIYDFSANRVEPGRATGSGSSQQPSDPTGDNITVTVTIQADSGNWMTNKSVTIPGTGATVYHAFVKALEGSGITQEGAANGYVSSMTRNGVTLAEFTKGENSGWLYKVNGELATVALTVCSIENGDSILWYYTGDWTSDPSAGAMAGTLPTTQDKTAAAAVDALIGAIGTVTKDSGPAITAARRAYDALTDAQKKLVSDYAVLTAAEKAFADLVGKVSFTDVDENAYYYEALLWAVKTGLTKGTSEDTFSPDMVCSRAQLVTLLWRAAGEPKAKNRTHSFTDVDENAYYYEALLWAVENGITLGTSGTTFSPDLKCSRAQMVAFLYRGAGGPAVSGGSAFGDVAGTDYFSGAVRWAVAQQITKGTSEDTFSPDMECSRAQMVTFFYRWLGK